MTARAAVAFVVLTGAISSPAGVPQPRSEDPVFVAVYERGPSFVNGKDVPEQPRFWEHVDHLRSRAEKIIAGGPFPVVEGDKVVGLVVFQATDAKAAEAWIAKDPCVVAGVFRAAVRQWRVSSIRAFDKAPPAQR